MSVLDVSEANMKHRTNFKTGFAVGVISYFGFIIIALALEQYNQTYKEAGFLGFTIVLGFIAAIFVGDITLKNLDSRTDDED